jgi:hypothetical protein
MASYRYERDIDPAEIAQRAPRQYTRRERWANWWDYNLKWVLIGGAVAAFVLYCFIGQMRTPKADYNIGVVSPYYLPDDVVSALESELAQYGTDQNGDGKVIVTVNTYTVNYSSDEANETQADAYLTMAGTTRLAADVQGALSGVFLLYDPANFEENTGALRYLDGSLPAGDSDEDWWNMVYAWQDCPVLAGLALGEYSADSTHNYSGDGQAYMSQFYVAMRGAWDSGSAENLADSEALWQAITQGARSTVTAEG